MKIKCNSLEFVKNINQASKIAVKNNINPIFECIYLEVKDSYLTIKATNLEIVYEKSILVVSEIKGSVYVKADILNRLVSNIEKNTSLEIERKENVLSIKSSKEEIEIDIFDIEESFPKSPIKTSDNISINIKALKDSVKSVAFASSKSEIKPEIASVYVFNKDDSVYFVSTDSYRLAEKRINNNFALYKDFNYIIPIKNIQNILQIIEDENENEDIVISEYEDGIIFENNSVFISSRIIEGNFPDYKQLFPKEFENIIELDKSDIVKSLNLNNLITTQYHFTKVKFELPSNKVIISAEEKSRGNVKSSIDIDIKDSKRELDTISYNTGYFLEGLAKISSTKFLMHYTTENKPVFIKNNNDLSFTYLLMPLNR